MLKVFIGVDRRQHIAYTVLSHSISVRASKPVAIIPLILEQLPLKKRGITDFTYSRYLVPYLCDYEGKAVFVDADFLCLTDINDLFELAEEHYAVQVVKNKLKFEWPSLMLFNCKKCGKLTPEYIEQNEPQALNWGLVGSLEAEWNYLVGYDEPSNSVKMVHFTQGIPAFLEMKGTEYYDEWHAELGACVDTCSWLELMGQSVHAQAVVKRLEENMKEFTNNTLSS